jgi:hypothetical protein
MKGKPGSREEAETQRHRERRGKEGGREQEGGKRMED